MLDVYKKMTMTRNTELGYIHARLINDIDYVKDGVYVEVASGTEIWVDPSRDIALILGDHVDISEEEYSIIRQVA